MSLYPPEFLQKMAEYRQKAANNTITLEEMRDAVKLMRQGRLSAVTSAKTAKKAPSAAKSGDDLLGELEGL